MVDFLVVHFNIFIILVIGNNMDHLIKWICKIHWGKPMAHMAIFLFLQSGHPRVKSKPSISRPTWRKWYLRLLLPLSSRERQRGMSRKAGPTTDTWNTTLWQLCWNCTPILKGTWQLFVLRVVYWEMLIHRLSRDLLALNFFLSQQ